MKTKIIKQREAAERKVDRDNRSTKEQLALITTRPGESKSEKTRLTKVTKVVPVPTTIPPVRVVEAIPEIKKTVKRKGKS